WLGSHRARKLVCCGGRGSSEAPTTVRVEAWGAKSNTSTLGLDYAGFYDQRFDVGRGEGGGALELRWLGIGDVGGNVCSRKTRIREGWWPAEVDEELAGTASTIA
uniref:Uncharacterized protein n=1 Tax=Oryza glumipatula TaxID=40148 RepID=A0A0E0AIJ9_9ORYZ